MMIAAVAGGVSLSREDLAKLDRNVVQMYEMVHTKVTTILKGQVQLIQSLKVIKFLSLYRLRHKTSRFFSGAYIFINSE